MGAGGGCEARSWGAAWDARRGDRLGDGRGASVAVDRTGRRIPHGYTTIELILVLLIGAILVGMVVSGASGYVARQGSANARDAFVYLAMRARASAIERGRNVSVRLSPAQGRARVAEGCPTGTTVLEEYSFSQEFAVRVVGIAADQVVCYSPRGFALEEPLSTIKTETRVGFARGADTAWAKIKPLGEVEVVR